MATIEKRISKTGEISYRVKIRKQGQPARTATFHRKTDAQKWARKVETDLEQGRYVPTTEARKRTVHEAIDRYIQKTLPTKAHNKDANKTIDRLKWWKEQLGGYYLSDLTPAVVASYREILAERKNRYGKPVAGGTINRYLAALSAVMKTATQEWHWIEQNPLRNVAKRAESSGIVRFLSDDERARLLDACRSNRSHFLYPVVVLALSTGARKGEILKLTWSDVDLNRGFAVLRDPKNSETRSIPLAGPALSELKKLAKVRRIDTDLVFPSPTEDKPISIDSAWQSARDAAGIKNFRFHDLRHSAASYLAMNGASLAEIAGILGHKTLQMVKRYAHLSEQHTAAVVGSMNEKIFGK